MAWNIFKSRTQRESTTSDSGTSRHSRGSTPSRSYGESGRHGLQPDRSRRNNVLPPNRRDAAIMTERPRFGQPSSTMIPPLATKPLGSRTNPGNVYNEWSNVTPQTSGSLATEVGNSVVVYTHNPSPSPAPALSGSAKRGPVLNKAIKTRTLSELAKSSLPPPPKQVEQSWSNANGGTSATPHSTAVPRVNSMPRGGNVSRSGQTSQNATHGGVLVHGSSINSGGPKLHGLHAPSPTGNPVMGPSQGIMNKHNATPMSPSRPKPQYGTSTQSIHSVGSMKSMRSIGPSGSRSTRSSGSFRTRHIKAAYAAKRASSKFIAANGGQPLVCFTCGHEFYDVHCQTCSTTYVPPDFKYSPSSAALFGNLMSGEMSFGSSLTAPHTTSATAPNQSNHVHSTSSAKHAPVGGSGAPTSHGAGANGVSAQESSAASISGVSVSGTSVSGASVFLGFYPDHDNDEPAPPIGIDMELIADLAHSNEAGLLEAVLFDCFCNVETVVQTFAQKGSGLLSSNPPGNNTRDSTPIEFLRTHNETTSASTSVYDDTLQDTPKPHVNGRTVEDLGDIEIQDRISELSRNAGFDDARGGPLTPPEEVLLKSPGAIHEGSSGSRSVDTFQLGSPLPIEVVDDMPQNVDMQSRAYFNKLIDVNAVKEMYDMLSKVTSTAPIRGILQGAQAVLQKRRHEPISKMEVVYICVVLQCPAIGDCSMFTKLTGPMQKLSRYTSLRSRARTILELCSGLVSHSSEELHGLFAEVFADLETPEFQSLVDLCNAYISHRLSFDFHHKSGSQTQPSTFQLVKHEWYSDDWRAIAVAKFMSLLWAANTIEGNNERRRKLPVTHFYNTMVDLVDLRADFDSWQSSANRTKPRFCFCSYPFFLSMGSKAKILNHAIQREVNAAIQRELFAILANPNAPQTAAAQRSEIMRMRTFTLKVRRQFILEDSMQQLVDWHKSKRRALRVEFNGEPGIDAGGLKKEWFLMFFRELFDEKLAIFTMDDTSNYCWLNKAANLDYCRVAGTTLGLALFNSVTIDFNLPLLLYKLLLDAPYDLNDIGVLWPDIAQSLQSILDYDEPDFEDVFGLTFQAPDGTPLISEGEQINVTSASRETYVSLMVDYFLSPHGPSFESFKAGFLAVCGGNAMTLFQPEELELLARGDRKPFDVAALRSVTKYLNFGHRYDRANQEPVVQWFWDFFEKMDPSTQAKLLQFATATDRAPAAGMVQMKFSIMCLGGDSERLPIAHTCFNQLCLYKYKNKRKLECKLSLAIAEYQGFGLK